MHQMGSLLKSQDAVVVELGKRLGIVERTPNPPKGKTDLAGATPLSKSMPNEARADGQEPLSKSELLSTLSYMNLEKGINHIGSQKTSDAICMLEGGNICDDNIQNAAHGFLVANPNLAQEARIYR